MNFQTRSNIDKIPSYQKNSHKKESADDLRKQNPNISARYTYSIPDLLNLRALPVIPFP